MSETKIKKTVDSWQEHSNAQLKRIASLTPLQRIRWLQQAKEFAYKAQQAAKERAAAKK